MCPTVLWQQFRGIRSSPPPSFLNSLILSIVKKFEEVQLDSMTFNDRLSLIEKPPAEEVYDGPDASVLEKSVHYDKFDWDAE